MKAQYVSYLPVEAIGLYFGSFHSSKSQQILNRKTFSGDHKFIKIVVVAYWTKPNGKRKALVVLRNTGCVVCLARRWSAVIL